MSVFMSFVWIWEQTAIISLYNINWLVFITNTDSVYCDVRAACLNTILFNISVLLLIIACRLPDIKCCPFYSNNLNNFLILKNVEQFPRVVVSVLH